MTDQQNVYQALLRQNFYAFVQKVFATLHHSESFDPNWHVEAMCYRLQNIAEGGSDRLLITVPPRHLKSICTAVALPAWLLGRDPTRRVLVASYGQDLATKHARDFRTVIEADWYRDIFPRMRIDRRKNTESEIVTTAQGGRKAVSVGGSVTGFGADFIVVDDLMKAIDASSVTARQAVKEFYDQTLLSRINDQRSGAIVAIQQRLHEDDLAAHLIEKGDFVHLNLPAIAVEDADVSLYNGAVHRRRKDDLLWPEREPSEVLERIRRDMGSGPFSAQYQQNPVPPDGNRIRWEWFKTYDERPPRDFFQLIVQSWDTAMTDEPTSDYSVGMTWGYREKSWYLLDVSRERLAYPGLKRRVITLKKEWNADHVVIEHAATGIPLVRELRDEEDFRVFGLTPRLDKETRVAAATGKIEQGLVRIPSQAPWLAEFRQELLAFPNGRYDDQVDSLTVFLEWIAVNPGKAWIARGLNGGRVPRRKRRSLRS